MFYLIYLILVTNCNAFNAIYNWTHKPFTKYAVNFRMLNGTNEFGSSSPVNGVHGVIHVIQNSTGLDWLVKEAQAGPYIAVLYPQMFTPAVRDALITSGKVTGVVVFKTLIDKDPLSYLSFDSHCPNTNNDNCFADVNPYGNSFIHTDWPVPVTLMLDGIDDINNCFTKFNLPLDKSQLDRPLCALHMKNHMFGAVSSEICMRRNNQIVISARYCDPLGGQNIVLPLDFGSGSFNGTVVLATHLDVISLFDGVSPAALSSVTSLVTLLTTAHILTKLLTDEEQVNPLLITLLNGEAYEYIGSSRMVYDMKRGLFPDQEHSISLKDVSLFIDLNQLNDTSLFLHSINENNMVKDILNMFETAFGAKSLDLEPYIPSSYHSLGNEKSSLPGIVITNYKKKFRNHFYHSIYDDSHNIKYVYKEGGSVEKGSIQYNLNNISIVLAKSLYKVLTGKDYSGTIEPQYSLVDELLYCYLENNDCKYMRAVIPKGNILKSEPESLYVGVVRGRDVITKLTGRILALLTSPEVPLFGSNCSSSNLQGGGYSYIWMNGLSGDGVCVNTTLRFTPAVSPAFEIENYNWTSGEYSTWTESAWLDLDLVMYLKPSSSQELYTLLTGIIVLVLSFVSIFLFNRSNLRTQTELVSATSF